MKEDILHNVQNIVNFASGEEVVNAYEGFKTINPQGYGYFLVTNYRFIFFKSSKEWGNTSVNMTEIPIDHVGGIRSEYGRKTIKIMKVFSILLFIFGAAAAVLGLVKVFGSILNIIMLIGGGVMFVAAIFMLIFGRGRVFTIEIFTKSILGSVVFVSNESNKKKTDTKIIVKDTAGNLIRDLGKTIIEAQDYPRPEEKSLPVMPDIQV